MADIHALTGTLDTIRDGTEGDEISVNALIEALNSRGFGPLLIGPALITILPTGAIPGMPDVCALIVILMSLQILFRRKHPWIPKRLAEFSFSRDKFLSALEKAKPYTRRVDKVIYPRLKYFAREEFEPVIAVMAILLSVCIMIMGFIPFLAALPASGILFLGLGLVGRDGLMLVFAFFIFLASLWGLYSTWTAIF
ncbi:exopolysaccharide biosynthesis protein [Kordiimonas gwangyangensis]|uniref:exopolysaccharide biosynthesis protein n=1 Tax=Kordiimonas gwangyangensis TaxID=288022 RepID=UPI0003A39B43|nr:exopolysaccharide biosynthesis protein [Kordiimonas gwangyangensis]